MNDRNFCYRQETVCSCLVCVRVMAAINSDEATKYFQQLSSSTESGSRLSPNRQKCPLCYKFRKTFHCKDCVQSGQFCHSNLNKPESYSDKQIHIIQAETGREAIQRACAKHLEQKKLADILRSKIRITKDKNRILNEALREKKQRRNFMLNKLKDLQKKNESKLSKLPRWEQKVYEVENVAANRAESGKEIRQNLELIQLKLKKLVKRRIQELFKYIFPICKINPPEAAEKGTKNEVVNALADAVHTNYIRDRWENTDFSGQMKYSIVAPILPGSGNYSAYNIWVTQNKKDNAGDSNTTTAEQNTAFSISAALTYTAQCVQLLSFYLDIRLPHKMVYSDFCSSDITETQFWRKVARLNANILYLCLHQNVNISSLRSCGTIHNIVQLLEDENVDLGRQGPFECDLEKIIALEQPLIKDLQVNEDSDSDDGDSFPVEWEAVPHVQCPEVAPGALNVQSTQMTNTQATTSMAGGLVNSAAASIASIWRGFTGGR